jgi:hypothetical protein
LLLRFRLFATTEHGLAQLFEKLTFHAFVD